jgi:polyisoprenoid-binding protein YceI
MVASLVMVLAAAVHPPIYGQSFPINVHQSSLKIKVSKSGLFSAFGHDHEVEAPIERGRIDLSVNPSVELSVDARKLKVLDPEIPADKRTEIQATMLGADVLDSQHYPEITYKSTSVEKTGPDSWRVHGNLTLHSRTAPVAVRVVVRNSHYQGSAQIKQTDFGITPVRFAGGTVRVKDEVKIDFDIVPAK